MFYKVKKLDSPIIIIFIFGYGIIELRVSAIKNGAYDLIPKPFKLKELEVSIHKALEKYTLII